MSGDALFPIPAPTFLMIHSITQRVTDEQTTTDRGRVERTFVDIDISGYLTGFNPATDTTPNQHRLRVDAVLLVMNNILVKTSDRFICVDPQVPVALQGEYMVDEVRPNLSHTRITLHRFDGTAWVEDR